MFRGFWAIGAVAFLSVTALVGCPAAAPPPIAPWPPSIEPQDQTPIAVSVDARALRPMAEAERERLRQIIDLAERREINEGGPRMLRTAKEESRSLDQIEARIDDAMRAGADESEVDAIHQQLRRFSTRLDLLAERLQ